MDLEIVKFSNDFKKLACRKRSLAMDGDRSREMESSCCLEVGCCEGDACLICLDKCVGENGDRASAFNECLNHGEYFEKVFLVNTKFHRVLLKESKVKNT